MWLAACKTLAARGFSGAALPPGNPRTGLTSKVETKNCSPVVGAACGAQSSARDVRAKTPGYRVAGREQ